MEAEQRAPGELLAEAAKARHEARRFRNAALLMNDRLVEDALIARAVELENLAGMLEAQAAKLSS